MQCHLAEWSKLIQGQLVSHLSNKKVWKLPEFWAHTDPACPNAGRFYPRSQVYQSDLSQFVNTLLPCFTLQQKHRLKPKLYDRLCHLASIEHTLTYDNSDELAQEV